MRRDIGAKTRRQSRFLPRVTAIDQRPLRNATALASEAFQHECGYA
jgi:hypothetical protein